MTKAQRAIAELRAIIELADPKDKTRAREKLDAWLSHHVRQLGDKMTITYHVVRDFQQMGGGHYEKLIDDAKHKVLRSIAEGERGLEQHVVWETKQDPMNGNTVVGTELLVLV